MTQFTQVVAAPPRANSSASRYQWMDISRGLGVLLIVVVHAGSVYSAWTGGNVPGWIRSLDLALSPFRIPLLIFLSGMLLTRSVAKGSERFISGKLKNLAWPYIIWTAIILVASLGPAGLLNIKGWLGGTVLWYLTFLFFYYAVGLLFARVPVLVIAAYALALSMVLPDESKYGSRLFLLMAYFFVGAFAGQHLDRFTGAIRSKWIVALLPLLVAVSYYCTQHPGTNYSPFLAPLLIALIICMCGVFNLFVSGAVARAFQFAGRNSLVYYVVHVPIYVVLYSVLFGLDITSPYVCIGLALVLGIAVPTGLSVLRERSPAVQLLFESPDFHLPPILARLAGKLDRWLLPPSTPSGAPRSFDQSTIPGSSAKP
jgi:fucose 4-O-acetylase-like acetyltransferase